MEVMMMNRKQFFKFFGKYFSDIEKRYFDQCWDRFEEEIAAFVMDVDHIEMKDEVYININELNNLYPFPKNADKDVYGLWYDMWFGVLKIHKEHYFDKKGGK